ncbi:MAG TPA: helix-turn-helix transcriptional regulator [Acidimicrobiales bacterium]|jgi:transcriptional regulator with XRE-family HTH domain|nr:helix-turn-helix transcriptional regulator [Acidimicrobiales bacterium]
MGVGVLLRDWRQRRHLSQLDLAVEAEVSTRHLSFVETGRSKPSRELVLHLAEHLDVPLRERNTLLVAAGYAPVYAERPIDAEEMAPVRAAIDKILSGHSPFPAIVVDHRWALVSANEAALALLTDGVDPSLLGEGANALRISLHPDGLAPRIANLAEWSSHLLDRLRREAAVSADPALDQLIAELRTYPGVVDGPLPSDGPAPLFVPLVLRAGDAALSFVSTVATFGTARDITAAELSIESFFPADDATAAFLLGRSP